MSFKRESAAECDSIDAICVITNYLEQPQASWVYSVVCSQVINEVCVNLIKKALMGEAEIQQLVQDFYARCQVIEFNCQILMNASRLRQGYNLSFWDSLIVACALEAGVEMLYSERYAQWADCV